MTILFIVLVVLASVILGLIVLVQNPKGGGLAGTLAGFSNQFMGVKQTTDVLEKGTWIFGGVVALLCLFSVVFLRGGTTSGSEVRDAQDAAVPANPAPTNNNNTVPFNPNPAQPQPGTNPGN
jgi:preprotein translocase subunit SecG